MVRGKQFTIAIIVGVKQETLIAYIYKERNCIERFFNRIKQFRRIATRYDKLAITFVGTILVASILIWLKG